MARSAKKRMEERELHPAQVESTLEGVVSVPAVEDGARIGRGGRGVGEGNGAAMDMGMGMGGGRGMSMGTLRNLRTLSSFKNPVFRLYYGAMLGQMAAMNIQMFARLFLAYRVGGESLIILGMMGLANALPMLFFSLFGGVIADRVQKKYVLLVGQAASALISLTIALTLTFGLLSVERTGSWMILIVAGLVQGTIMGLMMPARQAIIAEIVGEEQLMNAVALNMFGMNIFRILGPGLAGLTVGWLGYQAVYYAMTVMYLIAVVFVVLMPRTGTTTIRGSGALADVADGIKYVRHEATLVLILVFTFFTVLLSMPYMMLLPAIADRVLHIGEGQAGLLLSVSGFGAIAGSLFLASLPNKKRGLMLLLSSLILGVALVGFSFSPWYNVSLVLMVFLGLAQTGRMTLGNTLLQYYVDPAYRGRVMSLYMMEFGLTSFGVFFAAVLGESIGVQWAVGGLAIALVIISILAIAFMPRLRKLE